MDEKTFNSQNPDDAYVSVLMIAYNKEDYIDDAIKGVLKQEKALRRIGFGLQLVIMDDCSTDSTPEIIEKYRRQHPAVIKSVRNHHNLGLQGNYLAGYPHCRGRYLAICDADDYWFCSTKLSRQVKYMEAHPECSITFHRVVNYYEEAGEMSLSNGGTKKLSDLCDLSDGNYITNSSVVYRRALVDLTALPAWVGDVCSIDTAIHTFYATKGNIRYFSRPMGVYRKTAASVWSMGEKTKCLQMSLDVRQRLLEWMGDDYPEASKVMAATVARIKKGIEAAQNGTDAPNPKRLVSKIRAAISKFLPLPRP